MYKHHLFCLSLVLLLFSCSDAPREEGSDRGSAAPSAVEGSGEDDLLVRLSGDLVANPGSQAERDRNAIVDYAIEHMLDVRSTPSGLYYQVIEAGEGAPVAWGDRIRAHYRGYFLDGEEFDASYRRGEPMEFYVGNTIDGWNEGLQKIAPGGKIFLLVPSHLAYGTEGVKGKGDEALIPPNEVLAFEISVEEMVRRAD